MPPTTFLQRQAFHSQHGLASSCCSTSTSSASYASRPCRARLVVQAARGFPKRGGGGVLTAGPRGTKEPLVITVLPDGSDSWRLQRAVELLQAGGVSCWGTAGRDTGLYLVVQRT